MATPQQKHDSGDVQETLGRAWSRTGLGGGCSKLWGLCNAALVTYGQSTSTKCDDILPNTCPTRAPHVPPDTRVSSISGGKGVTLADGTALTARRGVVVAVDGPEAERLIGGNMQVG